MRKLWGPEIHISIFSWGAKPKGWHCKQKNVLKTRLLTKSISNQYLKNASNDSLKIAIFSRQITNFPISGKSQARDRQILLDTNLWTRCRSNWVLLTQEVEIEEGELQWDIKLTDLQCAICYAFGSTCTVCIQPSIVVILKLWASEIFPSSSLFLQLYSSWEQVLTFATRQRISLTMLWTSKFEFWKHSKSCA